MHFQQLNLFLKLLGLEFFHFYYQTQSLIPVLVLVLVDQLDLVF